MNYIKISNQQLIMSIFKTIKLTQVAIVLLALLGFLAVNVYNTQASNTLSLILTTSTLDGENSSVSVNGEPIKLGWYVDGPVSNCVIKQKTPTETTVIQAIDTTPANLPTSGTKIVTPPTDTSTNYLLVCDQAQDIAVVNNNFPTVDISIAEGTNLMVNPLTGIVDLVSVTWTSQNTDKCSLVWREKASDPTNKIFESNGAEYWYQYQKTGSIRYDGSPRLIDETTTFYITCYNTYLGEEVTDSVTLNVSNPPPPDAPSLSIWSPDFPSVSADALYGYAWVDVGFSAQHVTGCSQSAAYPNGNQYPNPPGWGTYSTITAYNFTNIKISTTTDFTVTCTRGAVTISGTTYPAATISKTIRIIVTPPGGVMDLETWDRSTLPAVTATISATPNPTNKNALTGLGGSVVTVNRDNATFCDLSAYYTLGTPNDYSDDVIYNLGGWSQRIQGNGESIFSVNLSTTTRLSTYCVREYDLLYGDVSEIENGTERASTVVVTIDSTETLPNPEVVLMGNAFIVNADTIWGTKTEVSGFDALGYTNMNGYWQNVLENTTAGATSNKISFPFVRPAGLTGNLDVYIKVCDENDGESNFRVFTSGLGQIGNYTTNSTVSPNNLCNGSTVVFKKVGDEVAIANGETITIECDHPNDGERCRIAEILFGVDGVITTPQVNPIVTSVPVPMLWLSENTTICDNFNATKINGNTYNWNGANSVVGFMSGGSNNISTSTTFSVRCRRGGDSAVDQAMLSVMVPYSTTLGVETTVATGQCLDDGSLGNAFGSIISSPPAGYGPDINGFCIPLVDLAAGALLLSIGGATPDAINGEYDNASLRLIIENLGPGEVPLNSAVPYKFIIDFDPNLPNPTFSSPIYYLNDLLAAPANPATPTESNSLENNVNDISFGNHQVCARVNLDGTTFPEAGTLLVNNEKCINVSIPVPRPPMSITSNRELIRVGQPVTISWSVHTSYPLNCVVKGPGGVSDTFDSSQSYPQPYSDSHTTTALTSASEFLLQCTEPITNTVFTETLRVDMVPESEER